MVIWLAVQLIELGPFWKYLIEKNRKKCLYTMAKL